MASFPEVVLRVILILVTTVDQVHLYGAYSAELSKTVFHLHPQLQLVPRQSSQTPTDRACQATRRRNDSTWTVRGRRKASPRHAGAA